MSQDEHGFDEAAFAEVDGLMMYIEDARGRAERGAAKLRGMKADQHLVEALERTERGLSEMGRELMQRTHFAVPSAQTSF